MCDEIINALIDIGYFCQAKAGAEEPAHSVNYREMAGDALPSPATFEDHNGSQS
jgi:hypothetical protein